MKTPIILSYVAAAMILIWPWPNSRQSSVVSRQSAPVILSEAKDSSQESEICVPLIGERLDPSENQVYTPAFRAAWTLLVGDILGEHVKTTNPIPLVDSLNQNLYWPESPRDWVLEAGRVQDGIIEKIKQLLMYKFHENDASLDQFRKEKDAIICYARMIKVMAFKYPFETLVWNFNHNDRSSRVACFGISKSKTDMNPDLKLMHDQVAIHDYRHRDDFIVSLQVADPSLEIILAKMEPEMTLEASYNKVRERMDRTVPERLSGIDELIIPKVNINTDKSYQELIGQFLANEGFEEWFFAVARQKVEFSLDESGALAEVTGKIVKIKGPTSRIYAFDKPFLIICREKRSEEPVLMAWVATTEVMKMVN
jgi:hypothetical protein